jgi:hypothetical protein
MVDASTKGTIERKRKLKTSPFLTEIFFKKFIIFIEDLLFIETIINKGFSSRNQVRFLEQKLFSLWTNWEKKQFASKAQ